MEGPKELEFSLKHRTKCSWEESLYAHYNTVSCHKKYRKMFKCILSTLKVSLHSYLRISLAVLPS